MQRYADTVLTNKDEPAIGLDVTVKNLDGTLATIYSDNGVTLAPNPLKTDRDGLFAFYVANGHYSITISGNGIATQTIPDVLIQDATDAVTSAANSAAAALASQNAAASSASAAQVSQSAAATSATNAANSATSAANSAAKIPSPAAADANKFIQVDANGVNYKLNDASSHRTAMGLGSAAVKDTGTGAGQLPAMDASGRYPAADGSQITNIFRRNRVIDGNFIINQRNYVSGAALAAGAYGHDRWKAGSGGCTYTFTQNKSDTTITITTGSLQQIIEDVNIEGGTFTLSWSGTAQGRVNGAAYGASPVTVTGLAAGTAVTVEFNAGTLGKVQFEANSQPTAFERRHYGQELALCQRYYETGGFSIVYAPTASGQVQRVMIGYRVTKRATATITLTTTYTASAGAATQTGPNNIDACAVQTQSTAASSSAEATGTWTASAEL